MGHNAGGETSLHALCAHLHSRGHDVSVLVGERSEVPSYTFDGIPVQTVSTAAEAKALPLQAFTNCDVVLTQLNCSYRAGILGRMVGTPVVHYAHNTGPFTTRMLRNHSDAAIYNSDWVREYCQNEGVWTPGEILRPVVNPDEYATTGTRARKYITLINLSTGDDGLYDKGYRTFFELARRNPDLPFLGVRGAYGIQAYEDLNNVTYVDHTNDILPVYRQTRVLLVPSLYESYGRVAVEAAASGIPAICTPTPGLQEAMGDAALYADYGDHDTWDLRLKEVLADRKAYSALALAHSRDVSARSQLELQDVELMLRIIHEGGLQDYYSYKGQ